MITLPAEIALSYALASGTVSSRAGGATASYITDQSLKTRNHLRNSFSLGLGKEVFNELLDIFEECSKPNWDGESSEPITHDTYLNAFRFLEALPLGFQSPSIGVEPDGHITLEWYKAPRKTLSVSVSPDGFLYYSALMGVRRTNGAEPFVGDVPRIILELVGKVYAS